MVGDKPRLTLLGLGGQRTRGHVTSEEPSLTAFQRGSSAVPRGLVWSPGLRGQPGGGGTSCRQSPRARVAHLPPPAPASCLPSDPPGRLSERPPGPKRPSTEAEWPPEPGCQDRELSHQDSLVTVGSGKGASELRASHGTGGSPRWRLGQGLKPPAQRTGDPGCRASSAKPGAKVREEVSSVHPHLGHTPARTEGRLSWATSHSLMPVPPQWPGCRSPRTAGAGPGSWPLPPGQDHQVGKGSDVVSLGWSPANSEVGGRLGPQAQGRL